MQIDKLVPLNRLITEDLKAEERLQGHYLTGNTEKSFENRETLENGVLILEGYAAAHVEVLEDGVPAGRIPYNPDVRTGAKHSQYIEALQQYAMLRFGVGEQEGLRAAFAIARKHKMEGMPTESSKAFSQTGERINAVLNTFIQNEDKYFEIMDEAIAAEFDKGLFEKSTEFF